MPTYILKGGDSMETRQRFGLRKTTLGLVSVLLGTFILLTPTVQAADTIDDTVYSTTAITDDTTTTPDTAANTTDSTTEVEAYDEEDLPDSILVEDVGVTDAEAESLKAEVKEIVEKPDAEVAKRTDGYELPVEELQEQGERYNNQLITDSALKYKTQNNKTDIRQLTDLDAQPVEIDSEIKEANREELLEYKRTHLPTSPQDLSKTDPDHYDDLFVPFTRSKMMNESNVTTDSYIIHNSNLPTGYEYVLLNPINGTSTSTISLSRIQFKDDVEERSYEGYPSAKYYTIPASERLYATEEQLGYYPVKGLIIQGTGSSTKTLVGQERTIPFETIRRASTKMLPGDEDRIVVDGEVGTRRQRATYTYDSVSNTFEQDEKSLTEEITKQPVTQIIEYAATRKEKAIPIEEITEENNQLPEGIEEISNEGQKGLTIEYYDENGELIETKVQTEMVPKVIQVGTGELTESVTTETEETPYEIEYQDNPDLPAGEENIIQNGKNRVVLVTTTQPLLNGEPYGEATVTREEQKAGQSEIIERGTGIITTHTEELIKTYPHQVTYREDKHLKKGESHISQQGQDGKIRIICQQEFLNGQPYGDVIETYEVIQEEIESIVLVGTDEEKMVPIVSKEDDEVKIDSQNKQIAKPKEVYTDVTSKNTQIVADENVEVEKAIPKTLPQTGRNPVALLSMSLLLIGVGVIFRLDNKRKNN